MHAIDRDTVLSLLRDDPPGGTVTRVSLFLGLPAQGAAANTDVRARWERLLRRARRDALALGRDEEQDIDALLAPAHRLVQEPHVWGAWGGAAVFLGGARPLTWRLPLRQDDRVFVGARFHVKPLLPLLHGRGSFCILTLSSSRSRWIVADAEHAWEVGALALPQGVQTCLASCHTEEDSAAYCRRVDHAVQQLLPRGDRLLVLAGEGPLLAQLRGVCRYPRLVLEDLAGSSDATPVKELHAKALALVRPILEADQVDAHRRFEGEATQAVNDLEQILERCQEGRVASLVVASDRERWAAPGGLRYVEHERWEAGDVDLLDLAAAEALRRGGEVFAVPADCVPGATGAAAVVLRY